MTGTTSGCSEVGAIEGNLAAVKGPRGSADGAPPLAGLPGATLGSIPSEEASRDPAEFVRRIREGVR